MQNITLPNLEDAYLNHVNTCSTHITRLLTLLDDAYNDSTHQQRRNYTYITQILDLLTRQDVNLSHLIDYHRDLTIQPVNRPSRYSRRYRTHTPSRRRSPSAFESRPDGRPPPPPPLLDARVTRVIPQRATQILLFRDIESPINITCPITTEALPNEVMQIVGCGHLFSPPHLRRWLNGGHTQCPLCRYNIDLVSLITDFLQNMEASTNTDISANFVVETLVDIQPIFIPNNNSL